MSDHNFRVTILNLLHTLVSHLAYTAFIQLVDTMLNQPFMRGLHLLPPKLAVHLPQPILQSPKPSPTGYLFGHILTLTYGTSHR
jgi:hypothetical protein